MSGIIADNSGRHTGLVKASSAGGVWNLILTQTASASATIDFTSGLDSTYDEYVFKFISIHPASNGTILGFQGGGSYNETITSASFRASHDEADSGTSLAYRTDEQQSQGTAFQAITINTGNDNDQSLSGYLRLFAPSSTVFVKHFMTETSSYKDDDEILHFFTAGYFNTTSAIAQIQFKLNSGNIDAGTISLYGIT
tara:strand:- start:231 stop:821 length:591 start_codon:yes stop_codon:yes gene_type:complete